MRPMKFWLIAMTLAAVVSDTMLLPFYPQFFERVFGITDPNYVGAYIAACCAVVMLAFPFWARVARRIPVLQLLVYTQLAAGLFSVLCWAAPSATAFWLLSLTMLVFKGSYLLVYPLLMSQEALDGHGRTIGLLSVVVHFGAIFGALLGGSVLQFFEPRQVYLLMTFGDLFQILVCLYLLRQKTSQAPRASEEAEDAAHPLAWPVILRLGSVMFMFYFAIYLTRPFFARYWEALSGNSSEVLAGAIFALPGAVAVLVLWLDYRRGHSGDAKGVLLPAMALCALGLMLQASGSMVLVLAGRLLYGWGLFRATVGLDQLLYVLSRPASYAADFSKISVFQNLGVLVSSFATGALVAFAGPRPTFLAGALGLALTLVLYLALVRPLFSSSRNASFLSALSRSET
ncbi:MFS transporter [Alcanivorax sp.]|uniref:MFS transporter n=1 Tax=Alcanivorax sp. TaxID=1872427 RepID=UPI002631D765|nr:MFS transporter [Alcanivorax sp.]